MLRQSSKKADLKKHNTQHMSQDNVVEVVTDHAEDVVVDDSMDAVEGNAADTFMDNVKDVVEVDAGEVDAVEVNAENVVDDSMENAEVGNEVQGGGVFINRRVKVYTNMKPAENFFMGKKHAENFIVEGEIYIKAGERLTGGLHNILRFDFEDVYVQAVNYINIYEEVVSQPTTKHIMVVLAIKENKVVKNTEEAEGLERVQVMATVIAATARLSQGTEEDANCLSKAIGEGQNVVEDYTGIRDTAIAPKVDHCREDSNQGGGLSELGEQLKVFPPAQREKKNKVAKKQSTEKNITKNEAKDKQNELEKSWQMQTSRIYQLLSLGCIGWQRVPPNCLPQL